MSLTRSTFIGWFHVASNRFQWSRCTRLNNRRRNNEKVDQCKEDDHVYRIRKEANKSSVSRWSRVVESSGSNLTYPIFPWSFWWYQLLVGESSTARTAGDRTLPSWMRCGLVRDLCRQFPWQNSVQWKGFEEQCNADSSCRLNGRHFGVGIDDDMTAPSDQKLASKRQKPLARVRRFGWKL